MVKNIGKGKIGAPLLNGLARKTIHKRIRGGRCLTGSGRRGKQGRGILRGGEVSKKIIWRVSEEGEEFPRAPKRGDMFAQGEKVKLFTEGGRGECSEEEARRCPKKPVRSC